MKRCYVTYWALDTVIVAIVLEFQFDFVAGLLYYNLLCGFSVVVSWSSRCFAELLQTSKKLKYTQLHSHDKKTHITLCSEIRRTSPNVLECVVVVCAVCWLLRICLASSHCIAEFLSSLHICKDAAIYKLMFRMFRTKVCSWIMLYGVLAVRFLGRCLSILIFSLH